jgi:hypothetical protein
LAHMPCRRKWPPWSFYPKTDEITCPKWNAYKHLYRSWTRRRLGIFARSDCTDLLNFMTVTNNRSPRQIIDLLTSNKSQYFAQTRRIILYSYIATITFRSCWDTCRFSL